MTKSEAFSRVKIDALLRDAGWTLDDGTSVLYEYRSTFLSRTVLTPRRNLRRSKLSKVASVKLATRQVEEGTKGRPSCSTSSFLSSGWRAVRRSAEEAIILACYQFLDLQFLFNVFPDSEAMSMPPSTGTRTRLHVEYPEASAPRVGELACQIMTESTVHP